MKGGSTGRVQASNGCNCGGSSPQPQQTPTMSDAGGWGGQYNTGYRPAPTPTVTDEGWGRAFNNPNIYTTRQTPYQYPTTNPAPQQIGGMLSNIFSQPAQGGLFMNHNMGMFKGLFG